MGSEPPVAHLLEEQTALRRVATLVAEGVSARELFDAVVREAGTLLKADIGSMLRHEPGQAYTVIARWVAGSDQTGVGRRWTFESDGDLATIMSSMAYGAVRIDDYEGRPGRIASFLRDELGVRSSVGCPIVVDAKVWGALLVHSRQPGPLPADTESRLGNFTELVATAIANTNARSEVARLAEEQAALRRVATLVAREASAEEIFTAIAEELGALINVDDINMLRIEEDGTAEVVGRWGRFDTIMPVGSRERLGGENVVSLAHRTGQPARIDDYSRANGAIAEHARAHGVRSAVATPIVIDGRPWGVMVAASRQPEAPPAETEARIAEFTELMAIAIANIQARSEVATSRARIVDATDQERRRVVRDLHDGAQQRLVHTVVTLKLAQRALEADDGKLEPLVAEALAHAGRANEELRELAHGILPSVLTRGGLRAGVDTLVARTDVPVTVDVPAERFPTGIEATAYFVVAEALTNVMKHARAEHAQVRIWLADGFLHLEIRDDGAGGAAPSGTGLIGLDDRLAALGGRLRIESPAGGGTLLAAMLPLP